MTSYTDSASYFWLIFLALTILIIFFDLKYDMLRDMSQIKPEPYSWSRVQLAWWTIIILSSFIASVIKYHTAPELNQSTLILLGISSATIAAARVIDVSDIANPAIALRSQDMKSANFLLDILSDQNGVSIYRFQTAVFNLVFGIWFIVHVVNNLVTSDAALICQSFGNVNPSLCSSRTVDYIMPLFGNNNLILLGLSSATYAALKTTENNVNPVSSSIPAEEAVG